MVPGEHVNKITVGSVYHSDEYSKQKTAPGHHQAC